MNETDYGIYCKKCFLKKHKLSKKNLDRIVYTPYVEECTNCGKKEKLDKEPEKSCKDDAQPTAQDVIVLPDTKGE